VRVPQPLAARSRPPAGGRRRLPPPRTVRVTVMVSRCSYPMGEALASLLSKTMETVALVTPLWPDLYTRSVSDAARTWDRLLMPRTKQIASNTFDLPDPFKPVMALNAGSQPLITVRVAYDLKPSITISLMCILARESGPERRSPRCRPPQRRCAPPNARCVKTRRARLGNGGFGAALEAFGSVTRSTAPARSRHGASAHETAVHVSCGASGEFGCSCHDFACRVRSPVRPAASGDGKLDEGYGHVLSEADSRLQVGWRR